LKKIPDIPEVILIKVMDMSVKVLKSLVIKFHQNKKCFVNRGLGPMYIPIQKKLNFK
jgi:hypothetical protein